MPDTMITTLPLRALRRQCVAAFRASTEAIRMADEERSRVRRENHPACPAHLHVEWDDETGQKQTRPALEDDYALLVQRGDLSAADGKRLTSELREWRAACEAADAQHPRLKELREKAEAADARWIELDNQFADAPTHSLEDIGVKLKFFTKMEDMSDGEDANMPERLIFGLIRDIERMTGTKI